MSGVVLGGVVEVVGSNLARGKIFTASIGSVDSLYPSVYIYLNLYLFNMCFVKCWVMPRRGKNSSSMRLITTRKGLVCESP